MVRVPVMNCVDPNTGRLLNTPDWLLIIFPLKAICWSALKITYSAKMALLPRKTTNRLSIKLADLLVWVQYKVLIAAEVTEVQSGERRIPKR